MELLKSLKSKLGKKETDATPSAKKSTTKKGSVAKPRKKSAPKGKTSVQKAALFNTVLVGPHTTEKSAAATSDHKYIFTVAPGANKVQVQSAVHAIYNIKPRKVHMITQKGKNVRYGKQKGRRKDTKKAIVTLPAGKTLDIYEGV